MAIKEWITLYPGALDTTLPANMEDVFDNQDEVIASHPKANRNAIIALEKEGFVLKDNVSITGATSKCITRETHNVEVVVGSLLLDAARLEHMVASFRLIGSYISASGAGSAKLRLYDLGAPGVPLTPPELRSTLTIPFASAGDVVHISSVLTPSGSPGTDADEVFTGVRMYELRAIITPGQALDSFKIAWAGVGLGIAQP